MSHNIPHDPLSRAKRNYSVQEERGVVHQRHRHGSRACQLRTLKDRNFLEVFCKLDNPTHHAEKTHSKHHKVAGVTDDKNTGGMEVITTFLHSNLITWVISEIHNTQTLVV